MFKIFIFSVIVLFLIVAVAIFIFIKTFDIGKYKPQIISTLENTLNRPVDFKDISLKLSLKKGAVIYLGDLGIKEKTDFGSGDFFTAGQIFINIDILDFLLHRQIRLLDVYADSLQIKVIRLKDGRVNVQTLGRSSSKAVSPSSQAASLSPDTAALSSHEDSNNLVQARENLSSTKALPEVFIQRIRIENAEVQYTDYFLNPSQNLSFQQISLNIDNFSLKDKFDFRIEAAYVSEIPDIFLNGSAQISLDTQMFLITGMQITTDLSKISLKQLQESMPMLKGIPFPHAVKGHLKVITDEFSADTKGLVSLKGNVVLTEGAASIKEIAVPLEPVEGKCIFSESALKLEDIILSAGKGKVYFSGSLDDYLEEQKFLGEVKIEAIDLSEVINQKDSAIKIRGFLSGSHTAEGHGFKPPKMLSSLRGTGNFEIKEGKLMDINILKMALDKISFFPNLAQTLEASLPVRFKEKLQQKDTVVTGFTVTTGIKDGFVFIDSINVEADGFLFEGAGQIGFDGKYNLEGLFIVPEDLTAQIISIVPEMDFLLNDYQEIQFPLKISGEGDKVSFMPDIKKVGTSIIKNKAKQQLQNILEKVIDKEGAQTPTESLPDNVEPSDAPSLPDSNSEKKSNQQQIIEGILDTIFKK